jgi:hypothetical protein
VIDTKVYVLGRDSIGWVADSEGMRYYLTDCCGASAKGSEVGIVCRSCYHLIPEELGGLPWQGQGRCSCIGPCADGRTYGANSCAVHGSMPPSQRVDTTAVPPVEEWQAAARRRGRPIPEYEVLAA